MNCGLFAAAFGGLRAQEYRQWALRAIPVRPVIARPEFRCGYAVAGIDQLRGFSDSLAGK